MSLTGRTHRRRSRLTWCRVESPWTTRFRSTWVGSRRTCKSGACKWRASSSSWTRGTRFRSSRGTARNDRQPERGGDPRDSAAGPAAARAGRAERDDPQGDRGPGQAHPGSGGGDSRGRQSQAARGPVPSRSSPRSAPRRRRPATGGSSPWRSGSGPATRRSPTWPPRPRNS